MEENVERIFNEDARDKKFIARGARYKTPSVKGSRKAVQFPSDQWVGKKRNIPDYMKPSPVISYNIGGQAMQHEHKPLFDLLDAYYDEFHSKRVRPARLTSAILTYLEENDLHPHAITYAAFQMLSQPAKVYFLRLADVCGFSNVMREAMEEVRSTSNAYKIFNNCGYSGSNNKYALPVAPGKSYFKVNESMKTPTMIQSVIDVITKPEYEFKSKQVTEDDKQVDNSTTSIYPEPITEFICDKSKKDDTPEEAQAEVPVEDISNESNVACDPEGSVKTSPSGPMNVPMYIEDRSGKLASGRPKVKPTEYCGLEKEPDIEETQVLPLDDGVIITVKNLPKDRKVNISVTIE